MHLFEAPALAHEFIGEPIEQFRVRGPCAQHSEISRGLDEATAKMMEPETIGKHAPDQGVLAAHELPRQRETASRRRRCGVFVGDFDALPFGSGNRQVAGSHRLFGLAMVSPIEQVRHGKHAGDFVGDADKIFDRLLGPLRVDLLLIFLELVGGRLVVLVQHARIDIHAGIVGQQFLLAVAALVRGRVVRVAQAPALVFGMFLQFLFERGSDERRLLRVIYSLHGLGLGVDRDRFRAGGIGIERNEPLRRTPPM